MAITTLWTIQGTEFWDRLKAEGSIRADPKIVRTAGLCAEGSSMLLAYEWLAERMGEKIGRPSPDAMPLWAWLQWDGKRHRPDLRSSGHLPSGERGVRIEFGIDDRQVVLSDFNLWHFPLNYGYLASNEDDAEVFDADCLANGLDFCRQKPLPGRFHEKILRSWERIFDLGWQDHYYEASDPSEKCIQATFWELDLRAVADVKEFTAR